MGETNQINHDDVVRDKMTERYLLDELDPTERDEFEAHFFECLECANDVRAGTRFVQQIKVGFGESREEDVGKKPAKVEVRTEWLGWLRPALAAPALAVLLLLVSYQNLITYPRLEKALSRPQLLPWASLNWGTRGASAPMILAQPGGSFLLFVNAPFDRRYSQYRADLYDPAGKLEWSLTIPANSGQDSWPVQVPGSNRRSGIYVLAVQGITATGEVQEIGRGAVELRIQE